MLTQKTRRKRERESEWRGYLCKEIKTIERNQIFYFRGKIIFTRLLFPIYKEKSIAGKTKVSLRGLKSILNMTDERVLKLKDGKYCRNY